MAVTKEEVLVISTRVFSEKGYDAASVQDIAEACGISKPTLYSLYPSKKDIFIAVFMRLQDEYRNVVTMLEESNLEPRECLVRSSTLLIDLLTSNYLILMSADIPDSPIIYERKKMFGNWILHVFEEQIEAVYGPEVLPYAWDLALFRRAFEREFARLMREGHPSGNSIDSIAEQMVFALDAIAEKKIAAGNAPLIDSTVAQAHNQVSPEMPIDRSLTYKAFFSALKGNLNNLQSAQRANDIKQMISFFEEEVASEQPRWYLLNAIVDSIRKEEELRSTAWQLQTILDAIAPRVMDA